MKHFLMAIRPKTLLASVIPPLVSFLYFINQSQEKPYLLFFSCLISALCIQVATNFFNDVIDFKKGADKFRHGPLRVAAAGLVSPRILTCWAFGALFLATLFSIPILIKGGWVYLILGLASLYLTYGYTGGPVPLAYKGLGELFVFLFFGIFSVLGSYYLFASQLTFEAWILGTIYGLLTTTFICVNNLRDRDQDKLVGKNTMATKMPTGWYKLFSLLTIFLPYILLHFFKHHQFIYLIFIAFFPALKLTKIILKYEKEELNEGLKYAGIHLVSFSLLFLLAIFL